MNTPTEITWLHADDTSTMWVHPVWPDHPIELDLWTLPSTAVGRTCEMRLTRYAFGRARTLQGWGPRPELPTAWVGVCIPHRMVAWRGDRRIARDVAREAFGEPSLRGPEDPSILGIARQRMDSLVQAAEDQFLRGGEEYESDIARIDRQNREHQEMFRELVQSGVRKLATDMRNLGVENVYAEGPPESPLDALDRALAPFTYPDHELCQQCGRHLKTQGPCGAPECK